MNVSMKQKQIHRHREQVCGCKGRAGKVWEFGISSCKLLYTAAVLFHQFPWSTDCLTLHPKVPAVTEGQQLQQHRIKSLRRQMANALVVV